MRDDEEEEALLRSVAMQNAQSIVLARQRAEAALLQAKQALERKSQEQRATLQATWDGILVTDDRGHVTDYNTRYVEMWRLPPDVLGSLDHRRILEFTGRQFAEPHRFHARIEAIYTESPRESHDVLELADGRVFECYSTPQIIDAVDVGRVWSFRDITASRHAAEERKQLLESERAARGEAERASAMKDAFLATLSHELRTPLSSILGWSHILRARTMSPAELHQGLEIIERNARVQTQLIEDLLDMSRITSGKMRLDIQPVQPAALIQAAIETVRPSAEAKGIKLTALLDPAAGPISGDPNRLQQVVWNLLSNAIKFTGRDGRVEVLLERVNSHIEITVADTGMGISAEFLPHVFDRFRQDVASSSTRSTKGLGLGLSIVKHLVELHGGTVRAASEGEARGATFTIHLPLTVVRRNQAGEERRHPRSPSSEAAEFTRVNLSGITVLVVDDQDDARDLLKRVLEECDARVLTAASAGAALATVEADHPDVLVSDVGMPDVDGYELLRRVRALGPARGGRLPAIALTAFARSEDRTRALRAGFLVHVSKPVEPSELVATVASIVGRTGESGTT